MNQRGLPFLNIGPARDSAIQVVRRGFLATVSGDVIELGAGDGKSLPYYPYQNLHTLTLVDQRFSKAARSFEIPKVPVTFVRRKLDDLPFAGNSFDYACLFFALSSTNEPYRVLAALRHTLRPSGRIFFIDYLRPTGPAALLYDSVSLLHRITTRGISLNRYITSMLEVSGFRLLSSERYGNFFVYGEAERI